MPHIKMIDFVIWPAFRELAVLLPFMQEHMEWLMDLSIHVQRRWTGDTLEEALWQDPLTAGTDLTDSAKVSVVFKERCDTGANGVQECMNRLENWSVGPTFRTYVPNADAYVRIREEDL